MEYRGDGHFEIDWSDFELINITPAKLREIAQRKLVTSGPGSETKYMPTQNELDVIADMLSYAINRGQVITFGHWPNAMIKQTSKRAGKLYREGALVHPFSTPYVIMHTWDDTDHPLAKQFKTDEKQSSVYLIHPIPRGKQACIDFEALAFDGMRVHGDECLGINDRVTLYSDPFIHSGQPTCEVIPFALRFPQFEKDMIWHAAVGDSTTVFQAAMANVLDPTMTALAILNTKGVASETIKPSPALAKARMKSGKPIIPPYRKVNSSSYVTAILATRQEHKESQGGHHASPVPHIRMGHFRNYKSGVRSIISDTLVNATEDMKRIFKSSRSHYEVKD